jgi:hypothetical protein
LDSATIDRAVPLREPSAADWRSWEERQLTGIIIRAAEAAATGIGPHTLCRYLIDAMDWFARVRSGEPADEPVDDPFEAWVIERTLRAVRSEAYRETAEYEYLMAEWERGR